MHVTHTPGVIRTAALVNVVGRRLLLVRPRGKRAFYMPGGKCEPGEGVIDALHREVREELGSRVRPETVRPVGTFEDQAYDESDGVNVQITCFSADLAGPPAPTSEIEDVRYFTAGEYLAMHETAPAARQIVKHLHARRMVD